MALARSTGGRPNRSRRTSDTPPSVVDVDAERRVVTTDDGQRLDYDHLVRRGPLDVLIARTVSVPDDVRSAAVELVHNKALPSWASDTSRRSSTSGHGWTSPSPTSRSTETTTNFAKYAAANVPDGRTDRFSSWMTEVASRSVRPCHLDDDQLVCDVDAGLLEERTRAAGRPDR